MKCEICHLNDAARAIKRVVDGETRELFVCDSCAATAASPASGSPIVPGGVPRTITDILFSVGMHMSKAGEVEDATCPMCGLERGEMRRTRRLGCPRCFSVFETDIRTLLSDRIPAEPRSREAPDEAMRERELKHLRSELDRAIADERYEEAAAISARMASFNRASSSNAAKE